MTIPTCVMFNLNETKRDPRVRRIASSLSKLGMKVIVIGMKFESPIDHEVFENYEIIRVDIPQLYTKEKMKSIEVACPDAAAIINDCNKSVFDSPMSSLGYLFNRASRYIKKRVSLITGRSKNESQFNETNEIMAIRSIMLINLALYNVASSFNIDYIHCNDLDTLVCGYMLKCKARRPLIYDAHEIYPEQLATHMRSDTWHAFYTSLEKALITKTDARMTVCDSIGEYFERVYSSESFITIRNLPSLKFLPPPDILQRDNHPCKILYHGSYFRYRGLDEVIHAARNIAGAKIYMRGIGSYQDDLKSLAESLGVMDRVEFLNPVGIDQLIHEASHFDIGLNPFVSTCKNTEFALPNKFFEYMMAGLTIASSDLVEMRRLTNDHQLGILFRSTDPADIADSLNNIVKDKDRRAYFRRNSYESAKREFNWENEEAKLKCLYSDLNS